MRVTGLLDSSGERWEPDAKPFWNIVNIHMGAQKQDLKCGLPVCLPLAECNCRMSQNPARIYF
jgi:hypothetical protein